MAWGAGDTWVLLIALPVFLLGCFVHRGHIAQQIKSSTNLDALGGIMSSALSVGPMLMILLDPINKHFALFAVDMLALVINEARLTLWFAMFLAFVNTAIAFFRPRA